MNLPSDSASSGFKFGVGLSSIAGATLLLAVALDMLTQPTYILNPDSSASVVAFINNYIVPSSTLLSIAATVGFPGVILALAGAVILASSKKKSKKVAYSALLFMAMGFMAFAFTAPAFSATYVTQQAEYNQYAGHSYSYLVQIAKSSTTTYYLAQNGTTNHVDYGGPTNAGGGMGTDTGSIFNKICGSLTAGNGLTGTIIQFAPGSYTATTQVNCDAIGNELYIYGYGALISSGIVNAINIYDTKNGTASITMKGFTMRPTNVALINGAGLTLGISPNNPATGSGSSHVEKAGFYDVEDMTITRWWSATQGFKYPMVVYETAGNNKFLNDAMHSAVATSGTIGFLLGGGGADNQISGVFQAYFGLQLGQNLATNVAEMPQSAANENHFAAVDVTGSDIGLFLAYSSRNTGFLYSESATYAINYSNALQSSTGNSFQTYLTGNTNNYQGKVAFNYDNDLANQAASSIIVPSVGSSPFTYTNPYPYNLICGVYGGTVSAIQHVDASHAATVSNSAPQAEYIVQANEQLIITYSVVPTMHCESQWSSA